MDISHVICRRRPNGFGRIGRNLFRILDQNNDIRLATISDIADHKALEYLLRFDTILDQFPDDVSIKEGHLCVAGRQIPMLSEPEPGDVREGDLGVDVVIEATARKWSREKLEQHLARGAKRVILCAPPQDPPDITVVMGVNCGPCLPVGKKCIHCRCQWRGKSGSRRSDAARARIQ